MSRFQEFRNEAETGADVSKQVAFRFHSRALAALGRDLVTDDVVAVMELVKNAYDALASHVVVRIRSGGNGSEGPYVEIIDDGHGMDYGTIRDVWCVIATPFKQKQSVSKIGESARPVTGEKGLGRLSAARLGSEIEVTTRMKGGVVLGLSLNWDELLESEVLEDAVFKVSRLPVEAFDGDHGTRIRIGKLGSSWSDDKIDDLRQNLARLVSPFATVADFSLHLDATEDGGERDLQNIAPPEFISKPKYAIEGSVDGEGTIRCRYRYRPIDGSNGRDCKLRKGWAEICQSLIQSERLNLRQTAPGCGPFEFEIRAWDLTRDDTRDIAFHFGENRRQIRGAIRSQQGVSIYRDDILVLPKSDGARDWLGLDLRRVSRVGARLSTSQVVGCVRITKSDNPSIVDTSDREGLVSNPATITFRSLVTTIVVLLEQERHIDRMDAKDTGTASDLFASLNAESLVAKLEMLRDQGGNVGDAIEAARVFGNELDRSRAVIEKRFGYYNRLAVIGTIAQMVIHEIRNRTTVIGRGLRKAGELFEHIRDTVFGRALQMANESVTALEFSPTASLHSRAAVIAPAVARRSCRTPSTAAVSCWQRRFAQVESPSRSRPTLVQRCGSIRRRLMPLFLTSSATRCIGCSGAGRNVTFASGWHRGRQPIG